MPVAAHSCDLRLAIRPRFYLDYGCKRAKHKLLSQAPEKPGGAANLD